MIILWIISHNALAMRIFIFITLTEFSPENLTKVTTFIRRGGGGVIQMQFHNVDSQAVKQLLQPNSVCLQGCFRSSADPKFKDF